MELELIRTYHPRATNGILLLAGKRVCYTIELPWKNNKCLVSCIPEGRYEIRKRYSPRFGWHLLLVNVPARQCILLHPANDALKELKGCIAPVTSLLAPGKGILSKMAVNKLLAILSPALDYRQPVFLIIKSNNDEENS